MKKSDVNMISVGGKVVTVYHPNEKVTMLKVQTDCSNIIEVVCFDEIAIKAAELQKGQYVTVLGNAQSSAHHPEKAFSIFANGLCYAEENETANAFHIRGTVTGIRRNSVFTTYNIHTRFDCRDSYFPIIKYNGATDDSDNLCVGDTVVAAGRVKSYKKNFTPGDVFYCLNLVSSFIQKTIA